MPNPDQLRFPIEFITPSMSKQSISLMLGDAASAIFEIVNGITISKPKSVVNGKGRVRIVQKAGQCP